MLDQGYPPHRLEILVADGMNADGARRMLARLSEEDPRIRVIDKRARTNLPRLLGGKSVARLAAR